MYNVELYNMFTNEFVDNFVLGGEIAFGVDYMSPRAIEVIAPADINIGLKNTVKVRDIERDYTAFLGYVQDFQRDGVRTKVTLAPLIMLTNEVSMQNVRDELDNQNWAWQIYCQIYYDFMQNNASLYKLPFIYTSGYPYSNWGDEKKVGYSADLKSDMECIISARRAKGLYMRFSLYTSGSNLGRPGFGFYRFTDRLVLEADLENVIERKISETTKEGYNVALIWYPSDDVGNYMKHSRAIVNGEIVYGYEARLRVENPRLIERVLDHEPTQDERLNLFGSMLQLGSDNVEIELTYKIGDKLISGWSEGKPTTIITSKKTYDTYCTGYSRKGDLITLKFGTVRQDLTSILNKEGI